MTDDSRPSPTFKERMERRLACWYKEQDPHLDPEMQKRRKYIASLVNKTTMFAFAEKHNVPLPFRFAETKDVESLKFDDLPERIVVKPNNSADSDCVMLFCDGREVFSGKDVLRHQRKDFVAESFSKGRFLNNQTKILVEEFMRDYDDRFIIPRDFKIYVAGGKSHIIQVIDRNGPKKIWNHSFYDRDWNMIEDEFQLTYVRGEKLSKPPRLQELLTLSDRIAAEIGCFMRLDFFVSKDRVVFGEFTSYPFAGMRFTSYGDRFLCQLMDEFPDAV